MTNSLQAIHKAILDDPDNRAATAAGIFPLYAASRQSRILVVGQAPGKRAQESGIPWNDPSGVKLRDWLGVSDEQFFDVDRFAILPMDFYFPGKGPHGDLPPRSGFAAFWHPKILANLPNIRFTILIGRYAQNEYLGSAKKATLTETVRSFRDYLPDYFPIVHPSPLNFRWLAKNPWFLAEVVHELREVVASALGSA